MVEFKKSSPTAVERFRELATLAPEATARQMFGYPSMVLAGNMFMSLFGDGLVLRLGDSELAEFMDDAGAKPFEPMPGRPMRGFAMAPAKLFASAGIEDWVARAYAHAQSLPPKAAKPRAAKPKNPAKKAG
jgi:TfoX/Sxy family transcriptional regulator of competence genes